MKQVADIMKSLIQNLLQQVSNLSSIDDTNLLDLVEQLQFYHLIEVYPL